ncbi:hypothetical protein [Fenollaria timonensis]|uniref:hypothetical protein n=1 Tax=Fenollaria timonensis TaxID=1723384 RepID=UPI0026F28568|nr:hypothetical protein [Fenollaria timonensis]
MKKFFKSILKIITCLVSICFIIATVMTFMEGNVAAGIICIITSAPVVYATYILFKPKNKQPEQNDNYINVQNTSKPYFEEKTNKSINKIEIKSSSAIEAKIEPEEKTKLEEEVSFNANERDINKYNDIHINNKHEQFDPYFNYDFNRRYDPTLFKDDPEYEMYKIFEKENFNEDDERELIDRIITLYAKYYSVPIYFQDVEYIKNIIETKVNPNQRKNVAIKFLKLLEIRNNVLIDYEIEKEEVYLYKLKTKKGRLNRISRIKDNFYLYNEYLSKSNLSYLDTKLDELKARFRLDEGEIIEQ